MALAYCGADLAADLVKNCTNPIVEGAEKLFYIMNRRDLNISATLASKVVGMTNTYAGIVFNVADPVKKAFKCSNLINLVTTMAGGTYATRYQQVVSGVLLDDGSDVSAIIEALGSKEGEFVAVIEHKFKDFGRATHAGASAFQIIGLEVPLTSNGQEIKNDKADVNSAGGWMFALSALEPHARNYWFATSYAATQILFLSLDGGSELGGV